MTLRQKGKERHVVKATILTFMRAPGASCSFNKSLRRRESERKSWENGFLLPVSFSVHAPTN